MPSIALNEQHPRCRRPCQQPSLPPPRQSNLHIVQLSLTSIQLPLPRPSTARTLSRNNQVPSIAAMKTFITQPPISPAPRQCLTRPPTPRATSHPDATSSKSSTASAVHNLQHIEHCLISQRPPTKQRTATSPTTTDVSGIVSSSCARPHKARSDTKPVSVHALLAEPWQAIQHRHGQPAS